MTNHICPHCGSNRVRRSLKRGFFERVIFSLFLIQPYRCANCDSRFASRRTGRSSRTAAASETITL